MAASLRWWWWCIQCGRPVWLWRSVADLGRPEYRGAAPERDGYEMTKISTRRTEPWLRVGFCILVIVLCAAARASNSRNCARHCTGRPLSALWHWQDLRVFTVAVAVATGSREPFSTTTDREASLLAPPPIHSSVKARGARQRDDIPVWIPLQQPGHPATQNIRSRRAPANPSPPIAMMPPGAEERAARLEGISITVLDCSSSGTRTYAVKPPWTSPCVLHRLNVLAGRNDDGTWIDGRTVRLMLI